MTAIVNVVGREILDSRGNPTVEVDVVLEDGGQFLGQPGDVLRNKGGTVTLLLAGTMIDSVTFPNTAESGRTTC